MNLDTILKILDECNVSYTVSTLGWGEIVMLECLALMRGISGIWQVQPGPKIQPGVLGPWSGRPLSENDIRGLAIFVRDLDV